MYDITIENPAAPETTSPEEDALAWFAAWNDVATDYERDVSVLDLFERQVARRPAATAVVCGSESITYLELERRANRLAHHLVARGVRPNDLIAIALHRCTDLIVSILAVLKAGAAYVAVDPTYPRERLTAMFEDVPLAALLTHELVAPLLPKVVVPVIRIDSEREAIEREPSDRPSRRTTMDDLVYVIFTSGSTGRPKAAAVHHGGWTNLMQWFARDYAIGPTDKVLVVSSFSFDITQRAIAMPLIVGGELHLLDTVAFDPRAIRAVLTQSNITLMNAAPSTFYPVVEPFGNEQIPIFPMLRAVFLGGEPISASRLQTFAATNRTALVNVYGAAECSDVSSAYTLADFPRYMKKSVPAGRPIANTQIYLMNNELRAVEQGEIGEICIAGDGVGKGYLNDAELSARKFVRHAVTPGFLYRTGDLGRIAADGLLEFIGRVDNQIKLRGWRIDIGDVETGLRRDDRIREAVVVKRSFGKDDERLVAFVVLAEDVPANREISGDLKRSARQRLPEQMVPSIFALVPSLPMNPNGKIDRNALQTMEIPESEPDQAAEPPQTPVEDSIAGIFARVLKVEAVGRRDNFFDLGGYSSLLTETLSYINDEHAAEMTVYDFLLSPVVCDVAKRVETGVPTDA